MYYVIKRHHTSPLNTFISFMVPKYIASKNNKNIIFEFTKDGKSQRKWVKKEDVILFTKNKEFFLKTLKRFQELEAAQQKLVDAAQKELDRSIVTFTETMDAEFNELDEIRDSSDIPCILKEL